MNATYLFYDIESTGLNKCFDQVLQFAAIRTDLELNELERHEIFIKLRPCVIPSPGGIITHRIPITKMQQGELEVEAVKKIHALLNTPGTISLGYNTLSFDDEFLRFSFYRNLLPPYTHQFANHCSRMDLYPITVMYYLFKKEALNWPQIEGRVSLKLENLNQLNELAEGAAHNAIVDVEATLALAKKLKSHPKMWDYVCGYFKKPIDLERQTELPYSFQLADREHQEALIVSGKLGHKNQFHAPAVFLGKHNHYNNQTLWLRLDQENLQRTTADTIDEHTFVIRKKTAEHQLLLKPLPRFLTHLSKSRKEIVAANRSWLQANQDLFDKICSYHRDYKYPPVPERDIYAALYDLGFPPRYEEELYAKFHQASPDKKEKIALKFADPVRQELALRLLAENYPQHLSAENKIHSTQYLDQLHASPHPPLDYKNTPQLTREKALAEIAELQTNQDLDDEQLQLLVELKEYLQNLSWQPNILNTDEP